MPPRKSGPKPLRSSATLRDDAYTESLGAWCRLRRPAQSKPLPLPCSSIIEAIELLKVLRCVPGDRGRALDIIIASGTVSLDDCEQIEYGLLNL